MSYTDLPTEPPTFTRTPEEIKAEWCEKVGDLWFQFYPNGAVYISDVERDFKGRFTCLEYMAAADIVEALETIAFTKKPINTDISINDSYHQSLCGSELFGIDMPLATPTHPDYNLITEVQELIDTRVQEMAEEGV